jgi:hypothetical protein
MSGKELPNKHHNPRLLRFRNEHEVVARSFVPAMSNEYRIRFLDPEGVPIEDRPVLAESLTIAIRRAVEIAAEIGAADFFITSLPPKIDVGA